MLLLVRLRAMNKAEVKHIADYHKGLAGGLRECDSRELLTLGDLTRLHEIVRRLMDATFTAK